MKKKILFFVLIFSCLAFLFFQEGSRLYLDAGFPFPAVDEYIHYIMTSFSSLSNSTSFGFDNSVLLSSRFIQALFTLFGQIGTYLLFFVGSFLSAYYALQLSFSRSSSFRGSLLYTFNPVSLFFLNEIGFLFVYFSLPLIIISVAGFFRTHRSYYLLLSFLGFSFLISYVRLTGIYSLTLLGLCFFQRKRTRDILFNKRKQLIIFLTSHLLFFLPFLVSFVGPYFSGEKEYFGGLGNFASDSMIQMQDNLFSHYSSEFFLKIFIPKEIATNFAGEHQRTLLSAGFGLLFVSIIIVCSLFFIITAKNKKKKHIALFFFVVFLLSLLVRVSGKILPKEYFIQFVYVYFPFLANLLQWIYPLYVTSLSLLLVFILDAAQGPRLKNTFRSLSITYIAVSIFPLLNYTHNTKLQTIPLNNIPDAYKKTFLDSPIDESRGSLFYPGSFQYFEWSPYPIDITYNSPYKHILSTNNRLVNPKQAKLYNKIISAPFDTIPNISLLGLKDVFVFKDILNAHQGQFDFFESKDYRQLSRIAYDNLRTNPDLFVIEDNRHIAHFGVKKQHTHDYLLYSPSEIITKEMSSFFELPISTINKPIVIDPNSFNKPPLLDNFTIPKSNKNIHVRYKISHHQPTTIYATLDNVDVSQPFLLHLNKTFGTSRSATRTSQKDIDNVHCTHSIIQSTKTQNQHCIYDGSLSSLSDLHYLSHSSVDDSHHFEGNFIGNTRIITPSDIPNNLKNQTKLHLVLHYKKEFWYDLSWMVSLLIFITILVHFPYQERALHQKKE